MIRENFFKQDTLIDNEEIVEETPSSLPQQIGPYPIESLLGKGGTSVLYLGIHPETHEPLTIKVLLPQFLSHPDMVNRFLKEAEIIGLTNHPNIVKLYGEGKWEGGLYIAMEFIHGISLRQFIMQQALTLKRSLEIVLQIGYALFHLHAHGVIHRDLKPENIILTESGDIKVIDFGIAQLHTEETPVTEKKRIIGTPVYMSPEQKENPLSVSYSSDIFSLGIITYELVLGKLSHGVIHLSLMPQGLQKILNRALQADPKDRYQDIVDFVTDISNYLESEQFRKDLRGSDYTTKLFEELRNTQTLFLPQVSPPWARLDIGIMHSNTLGLLPFYYDFFELENGSYGIIFAEPIDTNASAFFYTALLRGILLSNQSLLLKPIELASQINSILSQDTIHHSFLMAFLLLLPIKNQLRYISCGFGPLWHIQGSTNKPKRISVDNLPLGVSSEAKFVEVGSNWNIGDRLVLHPSSSTENLSEEEFQIAIAETLFLAPQKQVETLMRRLKPSYQTHVEEHPQTIISIHRKS